MSQDQIKEWWDAVRQAAVLRAQQAKTLANLSGKTLTPTPPRVPA